MRRGRSSKRPWPWAWRGRTAPRRSLCSSSSSAARSALGGEEAMKTVLRLPNWVGDTLLALPAIRRLGECEGPLLLAGRSVPLELARRVCPGAECLQLAESSADLAAWRHDLRALRRARAERGILLAPSLSSALWLRLGGVPQRWGWPTQRRGFLLTHPQPRGGGHLVAQFSRLVAAARADHAKPLELAPPDRARPWLPLDAERRTRARGFLEEAGLGAEGHAWVALCPGVRYGSAKRWPLERFAWLARALAREGVGGLVVGAAGERTLGEQICYAAGAEAAGGAVWRNACGAGDLLHAAGLLRAAPAAVCNDTGTLHLAAAVGTPVVALFGPTDPRWTGPWGRAHRILHHDFPCAPCLRRHCPFADPAPCMASIGVGEVLRALRDAMLERPAVRATAAWHPAVLLDRDGTLIEHEPYLHDPARVRLTPGSGAALRRVQAAGYLVAVVTNQSGLARRIFDRRALEQVHARLRQLLGLEGVALDGIYVCPHHPDFTGPCDCRKPAAGLIEQALTELGVDRRRALLIGDTIEDLQAGRAAEIATSLVRTGHGAAQLRQPRGALPRGVTVHENLAAALRERL
ncbi:MAG: lipopolysaccharide heptosyltransferase II [Candidatus Eisenbacteria bacterium]|nr:lipopolysaccharide heptosyltransferase II [Candidatus Eisenbacteria bacterium]